MKKNVQSPRPHHTPRSTRRSTALMLAKRRSVLVGAGFMSVFVLAAAVCRFAPIDCRLGSLRTAIIGKPATDLPPGFTQEVVVSGLEAPTAFAFLPDERIIITEKDGLVKISKNGTLLKTAFLDIRGRVSDEGYRGLLAVEPDPKFEENGHFYLLYVHAESMVASRGRGEPGAPPGFSDAETVRVSRFTAKNDSSSATTERVILGAVNAPCDDVPAGADCIPADGDHAGGDIVFHPDGTMFISTGDGWWGESVNPKALRAQNVESLAGKLLRVTRTGAGSPTNPFWNGDANANRSKIWASGLRNPFRFSLHPDTNIPYIGDVGWAHWDEINVGSPGANYGWPCYEGKRRVKEYSSSHVCQLLYNREETNIRFPLIPLRSGSVVAGTFYTGHAYPPRYDGVYVYGDWVFNWLRTARITPGGPPHRESATNFAENTDGPVQISEGPDHNLYYLSFTEGELRRIRYDPP